MIDLQVVFYLKIRGSIPIRVVPRGDKIIDGKKYFDCVALYGSPFMNWLAQKTNQIYIPPDRLDVYYPNKIVRNLN